MAAYGQRAEVAKLVTLTQRALDKKWPMAFFPERSRHPVEETRNTLCLNILFQHGALTWSRTAICHLTFFVLGT